MTRANVTVAAAAFIFAAAFVGTVAVAADIPAIDFRAPANFVPVTVPPPRKDGSKTIYAWKTPDHLQTLYIDVMPWRESLTSFGSMVRAETAEGIGPYQDASDTHFTFDSDQCPDRSLPVKGYVATFHSGGLQRSISVFAAVRKGFAVWVSYENLSVEKTGTLMPRNVMTAIAKLCVS